MRRFILLLFCAILSYVSLSQGNIIWPNSFSELVTNSNATIAIQTSSFPNITVEGYDNVPTDSYIGIFYENGVNSYGCGGFTQWPESDENFVIPAFGDDPFTSSVYGFVNGQPYTWFLRINNSDDPIDGWTD